jgi:hypothetical protein
LVPPLSPELAVSFYLQNGKLMFAVYHVVPESKSGGSKFNRYQVLKQILLCYLCVVFKKTEIKLPNCMIYSSDPQMNSKKF